MAKSFEVMLATPVVVTEAELDEPYTREDIRQAAITQLIELLERVRDGKHGAEAQLRMREV